MNCRVMIKLSLGQRNSLTSTLEIHADQTVVYMYNMTIILWMHRDREGNVDRSVIAPTN